MSEDLEIEHVGSSSMDEESSTTSPRHEATSELHKRLTRQHSSAAQLLKYDDDIEVFDNITKTTIKKKFTSGM
jgi:hypothetical protein